MTDDCVWLKEIQQFHEFKSRILPYDSEADEYSFTSLLDRIIAESAKQKFDETKSMYQYLSSFLTVDYILCHFKRPDDDYQTIQELLDSNVGLQKLLKQAQERIAFCMDTLPMVAEYQILSDAIVSLTVRDVAGQQALGIKNYAEERYHPFVFRFDWVNDLYMRSRYRSLEETYEKIELDDPRLESIWKAFLSFSNPSYTASACYVLYLIHRNDVAKPGKLSPEANHYLIRGYNVFSFETAVDAKFFPWFGLAEQYAEALVYGRLLTENKDFDRGLKLLRRIRSLDFDCDGKDYAQEELAKIKANIDGCNKQ